LLQFAGQDVSEVLSDSSIHSHSDVAYDLLQQYWVGELPTASLKQKKNDDKPLGEESQEFLNLDQPLFYQLWTAKFSKHFYLEQVHIPRHVAHSVPLFANPFLDLLSKTPWFVIPLIWCPVSFWLAYSASTALGVLQTFLCYFAGLTVWSLLEYTLHRFLFHMDSILPDHPYAFLTHFIFHGIHHFMPMDR
jgi:4-hydroxysphinganine ceramide fatty acyl 2-hydroxylase